MKEELPTYSMQASIMLIPKPEKTLQVNCKQIFLLNIRMLNNIIGNYIKRITYHDQVGCFPGMQG